MYSALVLGIVNVFMSGSPIFLRPIQLRRACSAGQGLRKMIAPAVHTLLPVIDALYSFCHKNLAIVCAKLRRFSASSILRFAWQQGTESVKNRKLTLDCILISIRLS